jgi:hypothetical protein
MPRGAIKGRTSAFGCSTKVLSSPISLCLLDYNRQCEQIPTPTPDPTCQILHRRRIQRATTHRNVHDCLTGRRLFVSGNGLAYEFGGASSWVTSSGAGGGGTGTVPEPGFPEPGFPELVFRNLVTWGSLGWGCRR